MLATLAYGITGLRKGETTWDWPSFDEDPQQANESQMDRWSLDQAPSWTVPPLAIANQYYDSRSKMTKSMRYRLILTKSSDYNWLMRDRHALRDLRAVAADGKNHWVPQQDLPFEETILFAYAADHSTRPTYVCLPSGLHNARTGRVLQPAGPYREVLPLPGILFFDAYKVEPTVTIPSDLPSAQDTPEEDTAASSPTSPKIDQARAREEEARDILAKAAHNQADDGPNTRRAAIRAYKYLYAMVNQHGSSSSKLMRRPKNMLHAAKAQQPKTVRHIDPASKNSPQCHQDSHLNCCTACRPSPTRGPSPR